MVVLPSPWISLGLAEQVVRWIWRPFVRPISDWIAADPSRSPWTQCAFELLLVCLAVAGWRAGWRVLPLVMASLSLLLFLVVTLPALRSFAP